MIPRESEKAKIVANFLKEHIERRKDLLSPQDQKVRKYVLEFYFKESRFPSFAEISKGLNITLPDTEKTVNYLDETDALQLNDAKDQIEVSYPFSALETNYDIFILDDQSQSKKHYYANCAIDALGIPFMFMCNVLIQAKSALRKTDIEVTIKSGEITTYSPETLAVFAGTQYCMKASNSLCGALLFFGSGDEYQEWKEANVSKQGERLNPDEALYVSKITFQNRLKDAEV